jgi:hypothetical protein
MKLQLHFVFLALLLSSTALGAVELSGNISLQSRLFFNDPIDLDQHNHYPGFALEPEIYQQWDDNRQRLTLAAFYRYDQYDDARTHADIRELAWLGMFDQWDVTVGISKVFWGVTESQHLVDIINQTDLVENIDGEEKLGQPMIRFSTAQDWGILDAFILPGFRERTFAGAEGRPRPALLIDTDNATYESSERDNHIDYAVRWLGLFDEIELGLSYFSGTGRDPESFQLINNKLVPHYVLIKQVGIDLLAIVEAWTWKLEMISRASSTQTYQALTGGFEYTFYGIFDSPTDLGVVIEYLYDDRGELASSPFQNDLTTALRFGLNDIQSSEVLLGVISDLDHSITAGFIEASRRIGDGIKITLEARTFSHTAADRPLHDFRRDDFIQADLAWYF